MYGVLINSADGRGPDVQWLILNACQRERQAVCVMVRGDLAIVQDRAL